MVDDRHVAGQVVGWVSGGGEHENADGVAFLFFSFCLFLCADDDEIRQS